MIFILCALLLLLTVISRLAPLRYAVHAARASGDPQCAMPKSRWLTAGFVSDEMGRRVNLRGMFVGCVAGSSMEPEGLPAGATFIAEPVIHPGEDIQPGDIVVVDAEAKFSPVGYRLRRVLQITGETVEFAPDRYGQPHHSRPLTEVAGRVTYVVP
ncbi:MAG: S24 family peptidase [Sphingomonadales bacterium]|nr:MAG: S24 family peptidase [Sphingomonadales bacterium]